MPFLWHLLALIAMTLPNVLGYNMLFGKGKVFHFGPVGVSLASAYATFITLGMTGSYLAAGAAGLLVALLFSAFFAWLSLRLEPDGLGVLSIAVHLMTLTVVLNWNSVTRGALGIPGIDRIDGLQSLPVFAVVAACIAAAWALTIDRVQRSSFGRELAALAEHEWYAEAIGVSRTRVHTLAFLIAGVGAAITSFLFPQYLVLLHPSDYGFPGLIFLVTIVVAGGPGSVRGAIVATIALTLLREGLRFVPLPVDVVGPVRLLLFGLILFGAVWHRKSTLFPQQRSV